VAQKLIGIGIGVEVSADLSFGGSIGGSSVKIGDRPGLRDSGAALALAEETCQPNRY
jgi:hypothetical protein